MWILAGVGRHEHHPGGDHAQPGRGARHHQDATNAEQQPDLPPAEPGGEQSDNLCPG